MIRYACVCLIFLLGLVIIYLILILNFYMITVLCCAVTVSVADAQRSCFVSLSIALLTDKTM